MIKFLLKLNFHSAEFITTYTTIYICDIHTQKEVKGEDILTVENSQPKYINSEFSTKFYFLLNHLKHNFTPVVLYKYLVINVLDALKE